MGLDSHLYLTYCLIRSVHSVAADSENKGINCTGESRKRAGVVP